MNWSLWKPFLINWKTSVGGLLAAVPPVIVAAGFTLSLSKQHWLNLCQGLGVLLLGLSAKDATTHSTATQVKDATLVAKEEAK